MRTLVSFALYPWAAPQAFFASGSPSFSESESSCPSNSFAWHLRSTLGEEVRRGTGQSIESSALPRNGCHLEAAELGNLSQRLDMGQGLNLYKRSAVSTFGTCGKEPLKYDKEKKHNSPFLNALPCFLKGGPKPSPTIYLYVIYSFEREYFATTCHSRQFKKPPVICPKIPNACKCCISFCSKSTPGSRRAHSTDRPHARNPVPPGLQRSY